MFGFGGKKESKLADRSRVVGVDLTSSRVRAVSAAGGRRRPLILDDPTEGLPLFLFLDRRPAEVGRAGVAVCRKLPHQVCSNFLAELGRPTTWPGGRTTATPESAVSAVFDRLRGPIAGETESSGFALPTYLIAGQVKALTALATKSKLPMSGTVAMPLAVAAHRAGWVLGDPDATAPTDDGRPDWVVPIRPRLPGPTSVVVVDADEFALTATVVAVDPDDVKILAAVTLPKLSTKLWADRLIDAMADRCVRICRRDPRDSADAEQAMYDQLGEALDHARAGRPVRLTVRSAHWYQDLVHRADEFDHFCAALAASGAEGVRDVLRTANVALPPRAVWVTDAAAKLPGLAAAIYKSSPEQTELLALPVNAVAEAVADLVPHWMAGRLPRGHLDVSLPLIRNEATQPHSTRTTVKRG